MNPGPIVIGNDAEVTESVQIPAAEIAIPASIRPKNTARVNLFLVNVKSMNQKAVTSQKAMLRNPKPAEATIRAENTLAVLVH